jgi:hypothetical protein
VARQSSIHSTLPIAPAITYLNVFTVEEFESNGDEDNRK